MRRGIAALAVALTLTGCATGTTETRPAPALEQAEIESDGTLQCMGKPIPAPETPSVPTETVDVAGYFHTYYSAYYAAYCEMLRAEMTLDA